MPLVKASVGGTDVSAYLVGLEATPAGPGSIATARLHLSQESGGLDLRWGEEVKVWRTFNDAGAGIAARGRLFGGLLANRDTGYIINTKTWVLECQSYNVLLARLVRDAQAAKAFTISAADFDDQVLQLTQIIQQNGYGAVAQSIDATSQVANLATGLPAQVMEAGKSYGYYLSLLCRAAREVDPGLRPAFFIDTDRTFGVAESFGSAVLHVYDAALTPAALYDYHHDPTGAEKQIHGTFVRRMEGAEVIPRRQLLFGGGLVATYQEEAFATDYVWPWMNHGETGNTGYPMSEPLSEGDVEGWANAQNAVRAAVQRTAYPRETIEFDVEEHLLPGDVVTVTNDLEGITAQTMRVTEAAWLFKENETSPWMHIKLGARILRLGEEGEETLAMPEAGDTTAPSVPTWAASEAWVLQNEYDPETGTVTVEAELTLVEPGDMSHYIWRVTVGGIASQYRTEVTDKVLELSLAPNVDATFEVEAFDSTGNGSGWSAVETLHTARVGYFDAPPNMSFEQLDAYDPTLPYGWERTVAGTSEAKIYGLDRVDGRQCLRLKDDGTNPPVIKSGLFPVVDEATHTYYWRFWAKAGTASDALLARFYWHDEDGAILAFSSVGTATLTTTWELYEFTFTSPTLSAVWGAFQLQSAGWAANALAYVDAMEFGVRVPTLALDATGSALPTAADWTDKWFLHDTHGWAFSDGTRWLGPTQYLHFQPRDAIAAVDKVTLTANSHIWYATLPEVSGWWLDKVTWWVQVLTKNDGTDYWILRTAKYSAAYGGAVVLDVNTSAITFDVRRPVEGTINAAFNATSGNDLSLFIEGQKNGTPGNLEVFGVTIAVRKVLT
jgi:hypothetical protein